MKEITIEISQAGREASLKKQHRELLRQGYDGHNRHSGITDMHQLASRRSRRRWHMNLKETKDFWNEQVLGSANKVVLPEQNTIH